MKKLIVATVLLCSALLSANAQILRAEELEDYAKEKYGDNWVEAAENLGAELSLDKNNGLTYVQVINAPGKTAAELYVLLNYWFTVTFNDADAVIKLNDKELGTIIAQGYIDQISEHIGGMNSYIVSISPIIKCDIKEEKVRITYTVPFYDAKKLAGGGWVGILGISDTMPAWITKKWTLDECYPFAAKDKHKKTSCKALVMAHAYSNVVMDKIEECIKNGLIGNEDSDW